MKKIKSSKKSSLILIFFFIAIFVVLVYFIFLESGLMNKEAKISVKNTTIRDECSIIAGKLIHPIDREDDCTNKCLSFCELEGTTYKGVIFEKSQDLCNKCECFCN